MSSLSPRMLLLRSAISLIACFSISCQGEEATSATASASKPSATASSTPIDVEKWKDPVKDVLKRHDVTLKGLEVRPTDGYRTFDVAFKFDPQSPATTEEFHKLYVEVLEANQMHSYAFRDADDGFLIEVQFDTAKKEVATNIVPLK